MGDATSEGVDDVVSDTDGVIDCDGDPLTLTLADAETELLALASAVAETVDELEIYALRDRDCVGDAHVVGERERAVVLEPVREPVREPDGELESDAHDDTEAVGDGDPVALGDGDAVPEPDCEGELDVLRDRRGVGDPQ